MADEALLAAAELGAAARAAAKGGAARDAQRAA
jgi:hypothetical protein